MDQLKLARIHLYVRLDGQHDMSAGQLASLLRSTAFYLGHTLPEARLYPHYAEPAKHTQPDSIVASEAAA